MHTTHTRRTTNVDPYFAHLLCLGDEEGIPFAAVTRLPRARVERRQQLLHQTALQREIRSACASAPHRSVTAVSPARQALRWRALKSTLGEVVGEQALVVVLGGHDELLARRRRRQHPHRLLARVGLLSL
jgi:hypothetical protein